MKSDESRWCWLFSAAVSVATSIPYLIGFQTQGDSWTFTGFVFGVGDGNSYIAKMLQGQSGAWLFTTPYSADPAPGVLAFLPYLVLGKLAAGQELHAQLLLLYHMARIALIPLLVFSVYRFAAVFLEEASWRRWATALAVVGGGLGWLLTIGGLGQVFGSLPLDFFSPESFGFLGVYGLPHLILARSLLLIALTVYLTTPASARSGAAVGAILVGLILVQPLSIASAYAAFAAHFVVLGVRVATGHEASGAGAWARKAGAAIAVSAPLVLYYAAGSLSNPALQQWSAQNRLPSPHPIHYLLAYALVLVPVVLGARALVRTNPVYGGFLALWAVALLLLAYAPVTVQRRLVEGVWVALSVLAAAGVRAIPLERSGRRLVAVGVLAISLLTSLVLLGGGILQAVRPAVPVFRPAAEVAAFEWLAEHAPPGSVVLAAFDTGNALPAWAHVRSVIGHGPETAHLEIIQPKVEAFFGGELKGSEADAFLGDRRVDYVLRGPAETALGPWETLPTNRLEPVFDDSGYVIYLVRGGNG